MAGDTILEAGGAGTSSGGSRLTRSLAALILLMLLIAAALWLLLPRSSTIPDVVGSTSDDARVTIANAGFKVGVVS
jgi:beta-lactam-binding protein with PASTA domain